MENIQYSWVGGLNIVKMAVLQNLPTDLTQFLSKSYLPFFAGIDKLILKFIWVRGTQNREDNVKKRIKLEGLHFLISKLTTDL